MKRWHLAVAAMALALGAGVGAQNQADSRDMALLGHSDLQARSAYMPVIHRQGDRYIAYVGHHGGQAQNSLTGRMEQNGTSVVDVTNPRSPRYLAHIPGDAGEGEGGGAQMVAVCNGSRLPRADRTKVYMLRSFGGSAHEVWDVTAPEKPARVTVVVSGLRDTHKSFWECDTGIAYLVSGDPAWRTRRMTKIYDLGNPASPVFVRDYGVVGQQPGATGEVPTELHGPISLGPKGNRVYFSHGTGRGGIVQVVDREKLLNGPKEPTPENLRYPVITQIDLPPESGAHTSLPLLGMPMPEFAKQRPPANHPQPGAGHEHGDTIPRLTTGGPHRDFLAVVGETTGNECLENRQFVRMVDITWDTNPIGVETFNVPEASGNFCGRGGRFGAHASHENPTPIYYGRVLFVSWFNAGVRAIDIRDPYDLKEIGYYIPATTDKTDQRCVGQGAERRCKIAIQSNNVEVDDRGYIYIADRANTGLHVVELTGAARRVANFPGQSTARN
ncbi:MAG: hypothetical protein A3I61_15975 [Acidobacteria bacterium RIFCSPLOWO2_02_FULL_68_18]|nr:MAG: hypothetical protein A3I61_15975 [Acidobacteria bacterium RIFCSPLOWO2_02_FULL_68_18]OFW51750.1 MAG: hypothetical protein A3G77_12820 [Acidobacteria bacterium RIFCSPLOWO2_12_FULL_68_19]